MTARVKVCIIGNCQIAPMRILLKALHGNMDVTNLPAVHTLTPRHEAIVAESVANADIVLTQPISDDYPVAFARTTTLRSIADSKLLIWPNVYFTGYAPEYNTIRDSVVSNYTGPLLDYHSDKILAGFFNGIGVQKTAEIESRATALDEAWYANSVNKSMTDLREREKSCDVGVSNFLEQHFSEQRLMFIMNHPAIAALRELAVQILAAFALPHKTEVPDWLFSDIELVSAVHPDNPFIRQKYRFTFPVLTHYRGINLVVADTPLGVTSDGPRIYTAQEMVEACFSLYERHAERLLGHGRIKEILSRPWSV